jgi:hypothetical protein
VTEPAEQEIKFDPERMIDRAVSIESIIVPASVLSLTLFILGFVPYLLTWRKFPLTTSFGETLLLLVNVVALVVLHEAVHAIGWVLFGRLPLSAITFGIDRKTLSPYAHSRLPMRMWGYRIGAVLPGIVTGLLPALYGAAANSAFWSWAGAVLLSGAAGDLYVLWLLRDLPGDAQVLDHPQKAGCYVLRD